jgi:hypothetical protein
MFRTTLFTVPAADAFFFVYLYTDCSALSLHLDRIYGADHLTVLAPLAKLHIDFGMHIHGFHGSSSAQLD